MCCSSFCVSHTRCLYASVVGTACSLVDADMDERGALFRLDGADTEAVTAQIDGYLARANEIMQPLVEAEVRVDAFLWLPRDDCSCVLFHRDKQVRQRYHVQSEASWGSVGCNVIHACREMNIISVSRQPIGSFRLQSDVWAFVHCNFDLCFVVNS